QRIQRKLVFLCLMKIKIMIKTIIFISTLLFISIADAEDIFNGTILFKNNDWHFIRCSLTQDDYLIKTSQDVITQLKALQHKKTTYWISVLADVNEQQNRHLILEIKKIDKVHLKVSCHLLDAIENFENRE
ncbi:hypothetical protein, partial [Acinetobacter seifertii]|uniref:hypothetical protein n=2 Tax=Acinetobacter seifertii TaxID=1530123 RepID=UPI0020C66E04